MREIKIGMPCSPSNFISVTRHKCIKVIISYGGGIGGKSETFYCESVENDKVGKNVTLKLYDGCTLNVNPNFIVLMEEGTCVKRVYDVLPHSNYRHVAYKKYINTTYFFLKENEILNFKNEYVNESNAKSFYTEYEIEEI